MEAGVNPPAFLAPSTAISVNKLPWTSGIDVVNSATIVRILVPTFGVISAKLFVSSNILVSDVVVISTTTGLEVAFNCNEYAPY